GFSIRCAARASKSLGEASAERRTRSTTRRKEIMFNMVPNQKQPSADGAELLTKQETAQRLKSTIRYIERMIATGRLKALKPTGKMVRIRQRDLDTFLESGATIGAAE